MPHEKSQHNVPRNVSTLVLEASCHTHAILTSSRSVLKSQAGALPQLHHCKQHHLSCSCTNAYARNRCPPRILHVRASPNSRFRRWQSSASLGAKGGRSQSKNKFRGSFVHKNPAGNLDRETLVNAIAQQFHGSQQHLPNRMPLVFYS